jgi:hypothetical protein
LFGAGVSGCGDMAPEPVVLAGGLTGRVVLPVVTGGALSFAAESL